MDHKYEVLRKLKTINTMDPDEPIHAISDVKVADHDGSMLAMEQRSLTIGLVTPMSPHRSSMTIMNSYLIEKETKRHQGLLKKFINFNPTVTQKRHSRTGIVLVKSGPVSKCGGMFLGFALAQAVIILALQIAIAIIGDFENENLAKYQHCVNQSDFNMSNMTITFGKDKQIYGFIFSFLIAYNFFLCVYAILAQKIIEIVAFVAINLLTSIFSAFQVYQFRGFGPNCDPITDIGWLAFANALIVLIFNVIFMLMAVKIYGEFGWKVYKFVNCNPALRYYYQIYQIFLSLLKMVIVFTITFVISQAILILKINDVEFWLTIPFVIAMICFFFYAFFTVRRESHLAIMSMLFIGFLLFCYNVFKITRFATRSCPVCMEIERTIANSTIEMDRRLDFVHVILLGSINVVIVSAFILCVLKVWHQYGKGLADHFYIHGYWFDRIGKKKPSEGALLNSVGTGKLSKNASARVTSQRNSIQSERRISSIDENDCTNNIKFTPTTETIDDSHFEAYIPRAATMPPIPEHRNELSSS